MPFTSECDMYSDSSVIESEFQIHMIMKCGR